MSASRGRRRGIAGLVMAVVLLPFSASSFAPVARGALDLLPPVGVADTLTMLHDTVAVVPPRGVLDNDLNVGENTIAVLDSSPSHGTVKLRPDGGYTYTPDAGYVGLDEFFYLAMNGTLSSLSTAVAITITNTVPLAVADAYSATAGKALVVAAPGVLANDVDADGDPLTAALVTDVTQGTLALAADGGFTYTARAGFAGLDEFTYRAWDGAAWSLPAAVALTVSLPTLATPSPTPIPTPAATATPRPTPRPTPTPTPAGATASPTPTPTPALGGEPSTPSSAPVGGGSVTPAGPTPPADGPFALRPVQFDPFDGRVGGVGELGPFGGFEWAVPAIVLTVPGLLLIVALLAQAAIGVVWLPIVRRHLAGVGLRRRRRPSVRS